LFHHSLLKAAQHEASHTLLTAQKVADADMVDLSMKNAFG
jgi:hypothetical protein